MPIKDINDIINEGILPKRLKTPIFDRVTKAKPQPKASPTFHRVMKEVVPPLTQDDFLETWKSDRKELTEVKEERDKLKAEAMKLRKVVNSPMATWSANYEKAKNEKK